MLTGIIIGAISFVSIGVFHPIVIKAEYYFSERIWPVFLTAGLILSGLSVLADNVILSACLAVLGFSCFLSIFELKKFFCKVWFSGYVFRRFLSLPHNTMKFISDSLIC